MDEIEEHQHQKDLATRSVNGWDDVKQNCFRKAGFVTKDIENINIAEDIDEAEIVQFEEYNMQDFVACDDAVTTDLMLCLQKNINSDEFVDQNSIEWRGGAGLNHKSISH